MVIVEGPNGGTVEDRLSTSNSVASSLQEHDLLFSLENASIDTAVKFFKVQPPEVAGESAVYCCCPN